MILSFWLFDFFFDFLRFLFARLVQFGQELDLFWLGLLDLGLKLILTDF